jgi:D-alanyl-D-alanine carboxypeptidase (penicillin-binding protein 5/6)
MGKGENIVQANRNPILGRVAGADGLKTGHTAEAGYGFTGSAEQNGRRLVMVVAGLDSFNGRIAESVKLMDWGYKAWSTQPLFAKGATVDKAEVVNGSESEVTLVAPQNITISVPAGSGKPAMTMKVRYAGPIPAPIKAGDHIADLVVTTANTPPAIVPLVAGADVEEAGFFRRIWLGILSFFGL